MYGPYPVALPLLSKATSIEKLSSPINGSVSTFSMLTEGTGTLSAQAEAGSMKRKKRIAAGMILREAKF
jgi:hypothetical protein